MEIFSEFIQFGCNSVDKRTNKKKLRSFRLFRPSKATAIKKMNYLLVLTVSLSIKIFLRERGLRKGWESGKWGLGTRSNPGRIEPWWSRCKNRLGLVTEGRRNHKSRARRVRRRVGLWWERVQSRRWIN